MCATPLEGSTDRARRRWPDQVWRALHRCPWSPACGGRHELTSTILSSAQLQELVERMLKSTGRPIDLSQPFIVAMLPEGHRLHVVFECISRGFSAVNIRNQAH